MKRAQTWSTDALVGMTLFFITALLLYYLMGPVKKGEQDEGLQAESKKLPEILSSEQNMTQVFIKGSKVDESRLLDASMLGYENLKSLFGISSDFCIYFEDEKGNIVPIGGNRMGIGSPLANISGKNCNATI